MEKFEKIIIKLKDKIDRKVLSIFSFMMFAAALLFALVMTNNFKRQTNSIEDEYNRSLYELVDSMKNVEVGLIKTKITSTQKLSSKTFANIWAQSSVANEKLSSLPIEQTTTANVSKYLTQVGDYSYTLMNKINGGGIIEEEDYETIEKLIQKTEEFTDVLYSMYDDLNSGRIKWGEVKELGNEKISKIDNTITMANVNDMKETFTDYEGLIYDGAYSDHILNLEPKLIQNDTEISIEEGKQKIEEVYEGQVENIEFLQESDGRIVLYKYSFKLKDDTTNYTVDITKKGGKIYLLLSDKVANEEKISMDEAKQIGLDFLKKLGIEDVVDTYYLNDDNMATINYAAKQDGVTLYPDLVKVKVSLEDKKVYSIENQGYIFNHIKRDNLVASISINEAKKVLNKNIQIISEGLAVIPTDSKGEILVYEFKGKENDREYLIYVNANKAQEENVLLILETEGGILTM